MKEMQFKLMGNLMIAVHSDRTPTKEDWAEYIKEYKSYRGDMADIKTIVLTAGGGPNAGQRKEVGDCFGDAKTPVAVMTDASAPRMIVALLSLFNKKVQSFRGNDLEGAMGHLELPRSQMGPISYAIAGLMGDLGRSEAA